MNILGTIANGIWSRVTDEPVMTVQLVQGTLAMAVGFGLGWSGEQVALVVAFSAGLLGWIARKRVTPVSA